jgi:hypothetical protein
MTTCSWCLYSVFGYQTWSLKRVYWPQSKRSETILLDLENLVDRIRRGISYNLSYYKENKTHHFFVWNRCSSWQTLYLPAVRHFVKLHPKSDILGKFVVPESDEWPREIHAAVESMFGPRRSMIVWGQRTITKSKKVLLLVNISLYINLL